MSRIALIHAMAHSIEPIATAFALDWPQAELMNLLDDSLSRDLATCGVLDDTMTTRFVALATYAATTGADAILFTSSAFGPCIAASAEALYPLPVHGAADAMIAVASRTEGTIGLLATFAPTLRTMPHQFGPGTRIKCAFAAGALDALDAGDPDLHDALVADTAHAELGNCDIILLAQYSAARARNYVAAATGKPVLTSPQSAVAHLRLTLETPQST